MGIVVLKLQQLQHFFSANETNKIQDVLIFSKTALSKLYDRVGELYLETMEQKSRHKYVPQN